MNIYFIVWKVARTPRGFVASGSLGPILWCWGYQKPWIAMFTVRRVNTITCPFLSGVAGVARSYKARAVSIMVLSYP